MPASVSSLTGMKIEVVHITYPPYLYHRALLLDFLSHIYENEDRSDGMDGPDNPDKLTVATQFVRQLTTLGTVTNDPLLIQYAQLIRGEMIDTDHSSTDTDRDPHSLTGHELIMHTYDEYVSLLRVTEME